MVRPVSRCQGEWKEEGLKRRVAFWGEEKAGKGGAM